MFWGLVVMVVSVLWGVQGDSYLEAYADSHGNAAKSDREYVEHYPSYEYGAPPKVVYGPPQHNYGPPPPNYAVPHSFLSLLSHIKYKLDLFTIGKILLKIVIFKKFVSFVAIICLLLFIPTLKHKVEHALPDNIDNGMEEEELDEDVAMRKEENLDYLTQYVLGALESFSKKNTTKQSSTVGGKLDDDFTNKK